MTFDKDAPPGLKLLFVVVNRDRCDLFMNFLMDFEVNGELSIFGRGTADPEMMRRLGLSSPKAVIAAAIREDRAADAMAYLEEKFRTVRNGRGIAFTVPMSAMIGGTAYRYLSNQVQEM